MNEMNPGITINKGENFVHSYVCAIASLELVTELMIKTARKAKEWGFNRYLVDFREVEGRLSLVEHYDFAYDKSQEYGFKPGSKHALIVRDEEIERLGFVETVFQNAGYILKLFTEEAEALDWIKK